MQSKFPSLCPAGVSLRLASASPRRRQILSEMGLTFTVSPCDVDETLPCGTHPRDGVVLLAKRKAEAAAALFGEGDVILASDTLVEIDGEPLGKPQNEAEALQTLMRLSGKEHRVHTGVAVCYHGKTVSGVDTTSVFMRPYTEKEARAYIQTGEPMDKAGAYGIQGQGGRLVSATAGAFDTVVGLPSALSEKLLLAAIGEEGK